jgi:hypothetical protein
MLLLYAAMFLVVRGYYTDHLPHYDSVGSYAHIFEVVNELHRHGLYVVWVHANKSSMSWLQPAYALALNWLPIKAPEMLVSLNVVLLLIAQTAIVIYGRTVGFSPQRQVVAALLLLLPGAFYPWDGGIQDFRRDIQLVLLTLALLFLALAYVLAPNWKRAVALGVLVGLAQWSRDNAATIVAIVAVPPLVLALVRARQLGGLWGLMRLAAVPLLVFILVVIPYFAVTTEMTLERYSLSVWGIGEDRLASLAAFWNMPASVLLGGDPRLGGRPEVAAVTLALVIGAVATLALLWRAGAILIQPRRLSDPSSAILLASGSWVVLGVLLYTTLLLGYGPRWHAMPFLPMSVGLIALLICLLGAVVTHPGASPSLGKLAVAAGCAALLLSAPLRMFLSQPRPVGNDEVANVRAASLDIAEHAQGRPVAFLWADGFGRHHARYYIAQADRPSLLEFELIARGQQDFIDLDQPLRPGDQPAELRARLDRTVRGWADFVLVSEDTAAYENSQSILWPYQLGKPVVEGLLADPRMQPVAQYRLMGRPFVLLENLARRTSALEPLPTNGQAVPVRGPL